MIVMMPASRARRTRPPRATVAALFAGALLLFALAASPALYFGRPRGRTRADGTPRDHLSGPRPEEHAVCEVLAGFDLVYAGLEPNLAVVGFFGALTLLAALAFSYLAGIQILSGSLAGTDEEADDL